MNIYFVRFKKDGQLIQDIVKAPNEKGAIKIVSLCWDIPTEEIYIHAWRDAKGKLTRMEE